MRDFGGCYAGLVLFSAILAASATPALGQEEICQQRCQAQYDAKIKDCAGYALGNTAAACKDPLTRALNACMRSCSGAPPIRGLPTFGPADKGGMPKCLVELRARGSSNGYLVLANTPYFVWSAVKTVGQPYAAAPWVRNGPFSLTGGQRYIFRDGGVRPYTGVTSTAISPGLASLYYENSMRYPVWYIFNPLPPGCGGTAKPQPVVNTDIDLSGAWTGYWPGPKNVGQCQVLQTGGALTFINEGGLRSRGTFSDRATVVATDWGGLKGTLTDGGKRINWANGTWWTR